MVAEAVSELDRLTRKFRPALMAFFMRRAANHAEAEDMTQEVFTRLAQSDLKAIESSEAFIFRVASNLLRDGWRRNRVRETYRTMAAQDRDAGIDRLDPHRIVASRETVEKLWAAIQTLPDPTQQIFILYRVENVHKQTIADNFGFHVRTVEKHIKQALVLLAKRVGDRA